MRKTNLIPDLPELEDFLKSYGYPVIHVPLAAIRARLTPWEVSVSLIFTDVTDSDLQSSMEWRKKILDRIAVMIVHMRELGWVIHGGMSIKFDSRFEPPTCTLAEKLVKPGEEYELHAGIDFIVLPIKGELIEDD